ncbi:MAG: hypothetical protein J7L07_12750 [Candidatus Odinarchaeota archaeon]|nr:hypothetical protein [Candidatus Odinarchaeota archaeon]
MSLDRQWGYLTEEQKNSLRRGLISLYLFFSSVFAIGVLIGIIYYVGYGRSLLLFVEEKLLDVAIGVVKLLAGFLLLAGYYKIEVSEKISHVAKLIYSLLLGALHFTSLIVLDEYIEGNLFLYLTSPWYSYIPLAGLILILSFMEYGFWRVFCDFVVRPKKNI